MRKSEGIGTRAALWLLFDMVMFSVQWSLGLVAIVGVGYVSGTVEVLLGWFQS